jgi:hypothetical protein
MEKGGEKSMKRKLVFAVLAIVCLAAMLVAGTASPGADNYSFMVVRGSNNGIYYRLHNEATGVWGSWVQLPGSTIDSPGAAYVGGQLCVVVRGMDGSSLWQGYVNVDTGAFSGWTQVSGSSPSAPELGSATSGGDSYIMEKQYSSWTGTLTGWTTVTSLTTPSLPAGYYKVELDAHAYMVYPSHLGIGIGVDVASADSTTQRFWQCDDSPFVSGSTFMGDVHTQEVFYLAAGAHTFYFRAGRTSGTADCELEYSHITVTFSPDGSVS